MLDLFCYEILELEDMFPSDLKKTPSPKSWDARVDTLGDASRKTDG